MLGKIPGCSPTPPKVSSSARVADLAALSISPSSHWYWAQLIVYGAMLLLSFIAILPWLFSAWYWCALWLTLLLAVAAASKRAQRAENAPSVRLQVLAQQWRLDTGSGSFAVRLDGEILLWSQLIIIPLRELLSGQCHYLMVLPDSVSPGDWRRLSVWLNLCFARVR